MTAESIGESVEAPIAGEHYWIHLTGTPEGEWVVALRSKYVWALCDVGRVQDEDWAMPADAADRWIHIPYPTSTSPSASLHRELEPLHDA